MSLKLTILNKSDNDAGLISGNNIIEKATLEDIVPVQLQDYLRVSGSRSAEWIGQRPLRKIREQINLLDGPLLYGW